MKALACASVLTLALGAAAADPCESLTKVDEDAGTMTFSVLDAENQQICESCEAKILLKVGKDGANNEQVRLAESSLPQTHGCHQQGVLCLTSEGKPLRADQVPDRLRPGDELKIKVVGCEALHDGVSFQVEAKHIASADRLFRRDPTEQAQAAEAEREAGAAAAQRCVRNRLCTSSGDMAVLHETSVIIPRDDSLQRLEVRFSSDVSKAKYQNLTGAKDSVTIPVVQGRYFVDLGVLVPFVIEGRRRVVAEQGPASGTRVLAIDHDMPTPAPAVMLNVFPGGRRAGIFHAFAERQRCDRVKASYFDCRRRNHARNAANALGFQVGLDLDFSDPADAFFTGGLFEPVTGLSLNAGISMRKGQFLQPGRRVGQLVADDADLGVEERFMVRPYVGITLSLDIIRALIAYNGKARGVDTGGN